MQRDLYCVSNVYSFFTLLQKSNLFKVQFGLKKKLGSVEVQKNENEKEIKNKFHANNLINKAEICKQTEKYKPCALIHL